MTKAIQVEGIGKRYRLGTFSGGADYGRLSEALSEAAKAPFRRIAKKAPAPVEQQSVWALRDVSFEIEQGEVVGIVGRNGAGKSTALKILSRITRPTEGRAVLNGRVGALLEVGTGFHYELTGRENVYLNGAILGMRRSEVRRKFDDIVAFAEVERFLDTPVKRYSSGMAVRLAFAVAAHLEPEILIVDEVLAVGDAAFQRKCLGKMESVGREGRTVLFVSHNMAAVSHLCSRAIQLEQGRVVRAGPTDEVVREYLEEAAGEAQISVSERTDRKGNGAIRVQGVTMRDADGREIGALRLGEPAVLELEYTSPGDRPVRNVSVEIALDTIFAQRVTALHNELSGPFFEELPPRGTLRCTLPKVPLAPGNYHLSFHLTVNRAQADHMLNAGVVEVLEGDYFGTGRVPKTQDGLVIFEQSWSAQPADS